MWFALNEERPLFAFGRLKGDRGTKSKPIPGPHLVYGFLTTAPNAIVEPIHAKAMPVILTTEENVTCGCARPGMKQWRCSGHCRTTRCRSLRAALIKKTVRLRERVVRQVRLRSKHGFKQIASVGASAFADPALVNRAARASRPSGIDPSR